MLVGQFGGSFFSELILGGTFGRSARTVDEEQNIWELAAGGSSHRVDEEDKESPRER